MSEDSDQEQKVITRRSVLTHLVAGGIGWVLTGLLNPFRRALNAILSDTRFGREAKVTFGYAETDDGRYMLQVVNHGEETAENVTRIWGLKRRLRMRPFSNTLIRHQIRTLILKFWMVASRN